MSSKSKHNTGGTGNEAALKSRVKELEDQVSYLKRRLDELRKAKSTVVVKREREVLEVGAPALGRNGSKTNETEESNKDSDKKWMQELDALRKKFAAEMEEMKRSNKDCGHEKEINKLLSRLEEVETEKDLLSKENAELASSVEGLLTELSIKEAEWCEMEEKLNMKLKMQWGEKYQEWFAETEKKVDELRQANDFLKAMLERQRQKEDHK